MPRVVFIGLLVAGVIAGGCRSKPRQPPPAPPVACAVGSLNIQASGDASKPPAPPARPLLDFTRGVGGLPLEETSLPASGPSLRASLLAAHQKRMRIPQPHAVRVDETEFPQLRLLQVDVSNSEVRGEYRPGQMKSPKLTENVLAVDRFEYRAWPIKYAHAKGFVNIEATGVSLGLLRDGKEASLVLTEARSGQLEVAFALQDLREALRAGARVHASRFGFTLRDLQLSMRLDSANTIAGTIDIWGNWLLLPVHVRLTGRMRIDDSFNAHISDLSVRGQNLGGRAVAGLLETAVKKNNNKVVPLVRFAGERIHLQNLRMRLDERWYFIAQFGSQPAK